MRRESWSGEQAATLRRELERERAELARARVVADCDRVLHDLATDEAVGLGELEVAARRVTAAVAALIAVERVSVWLRSPDHSELTLVDLFQASTSQHSADLVLRASQYPAYFAALAVGRAIDAHDARTDPRTREFTTSYLVPLGIRSMLDASVRSAGEVVGVVCLEHVGKATRVWAPEEIAFAGAVGDLVGQVLANRERRAAEAEIRALNAELEERVLARTAELAEANRELEAFSYSVSHDLRAPLRHLSGFANILQEDFGASLPEGAREYLCRIDDAAQRMERLVEGLLELSRLGRHAVRPRLLEPATIIDSVWAELADSVDVSRHRLEVGDLPPTLGDAALMRQVWANLLDNAVKYSAVRDAPVVTVTGGTRDGDTWYRVVDNGVGFDGDSERLFGLFTRAHDGQFEGIGVGLALVKRIVTRHGGRITGTATEAGTTFEFTIPAP